MSDDSPQKGWDTWFSGEPDSSGGEQQAPEQQVRPTAPPDSGSGSGSEPGSKPEAEPDGFEPESELERTNWTVPGLGDVLEGKASQDADSPRQVTQPRPESPIPEETPTQRPAPSADKPPARHSQPRNPAQTPAESPTPPSTPASPSTSASVSAPESAPPSTPASTSVLRSAPTPAPAPAATPTPAPTSQGTWQPQPAQAPAKPEPQTQIPNPAAGPAPNPWSADAQPTALVPKQSPPPQQPQAQPQTQSQSQSSSDQPTQVWTAAPAAQQQSPQSSAQAQTQLQAQVPAANPWAVDAQPTAQVPQQSQPPQSQPPQSQPPQNPYSGATAWQQAPQSPTPPPAAQSLPQGYGTPPQSPPPPGSGYEQQASWSQPEPSRPAASGASAAFGAGGLRQQLSRKKILVSSGIGAAAIVVLATVLVMNQGSLTGSAHPLASPTPSGFQPTGTSVAGDAEQTADAFLAAWQSGDFKQAAAYTDAPGAAASMLSSYDSGLNLHGLQLTATGSSVVTPAPSNAASDSSPSGTTSSASAAPAVPSSTAGLVSFNVVAKVGLPAASASSTSSAGASASASASASSGSSSSSTASGSAAASSVTANWTYSSKLTAYKKNGGWWVQWVPSLVAPNLTASEKLVSSAIAPSAAEVEDSTGADLSSATDPGVHNIYLALKKNAPAGEGTPGVQIELATANGTPIANTADVLSQPVNTGVVKTTINPTDEAAAQQAVLKYADSSMVVIQPTTGDILAVANNDGDNDFALTAAIAPGSTDKILTSTALLTSGLVSSPSQQVVCPKQITVNGTVFNNSEGESEPANTPFLDDFAISCNNAFGQWYDRIGATTLADTAEKYYGLNQAWDIGTGESATYYTIPSSASNGELFQELFGQGQLETAPIAMASVAATVDSGTFKQPVVVPGAAQVTATSLPTSVQQDLWQMMHAVVTQSDGTAYGVFNSVNSTVYGKTGTADVGSTQDKPNSWMVVFDPTLNVAIACVVLDAGYGASYAGPETATALEAMQ